MINLFVAAACFLASVFFATVGESLRNFFRSRLASVCRAHHNESRFGQILRDDEIALQACDLYQLVSFVAAILLTAFEHYRAGGATSSPMLWFDLVATMTVAWLALRVFPWTLSRVAAEYVLYYCWPLLRVLQVPVRPLLGIVGSLDTLMHRIAGRRDPEPESMDTFAEEIQSMVDEGEREGFLESRAGKMIQRVIELREDDVRAVMTPRTEVLSIHVDRTLAQAREELLAGGHSRIPVIDRSPDDVVGILYARDLLESLSSDETSQTLRDIVRPPFYVPETTTIDALLETMKRERLHLAIVLDEYGGVTGLVTLEDILEEIVGDIADEFDEQEEDLYQIVDAHLVRVDARMHLDELNELFELTLPEDRDFDTIGGFVFSELGRVPKQGERLDWNDLRITVLEATDRKLVQLELYHPVPWPHVETQAAGRDNGSAAEAEAPKD